MEKRFCWHLIFVFVTLASFNNECKLVENCPQLGSAMATQLDRAPVEMETQSIDTDPIVLGQSSDTEAIVGQSKCLSTDACEDEWIDVSMGSSNPYLPAKFEIEQPVYPPLEDLKGFGIFKEAERFSLARKIRKQQQTAKRNKIFSANVDDKTMKNVLKLPAWLINGMSLPVSIPVGLSMVEKRQYQAAVAAQCAMLVHKYGFLDGMEGLNTNGKDGVVLPLDPPSNSSMNLNETGFNAEKPFGHGLSAEEYSIFFEKADVSARWKPLSNTSLEAFNGSWKAIVTERTESAEDLLKALGIGYLKRHMVATHESISDIILTDLNSEYPTMEMITHFPMNILKSIKIPLDCEAHSIQDSDTGQWDAYGCFLEGRILQRRVGKLGVMYDVRAILDTDPLGLETGPLQVFQWSFIPHKTGKIITSERWMKKV